jgi:hypothetical protein
MPDDHHPLPTRRNPEDINLGCIQTDLEFLIERVSKLRTRGESAFESLIIIGCSAGLVIAWIELVHRVCL